MNTPKPLALQLYTLRETAAQDLPGTIAAVAAAGYVGVELAGLYGHPPAIVRRWLADEGLTVTSAHAGLQDEESQRRMLGDLAEVGVPVWVVPSAPRERFADMGAVRSLAEDLSRRAATAAGLGLAFGYHNHEWELQSIIDGESALVHLFRALDPAAIAEVDIYWAKFGGADPAALITELGPRAQLLHVKDGPAATRDDDHVAVGSGTIDIPGILAGGAHVRWHIVELDRCATDMLEAAQASARWLTGQGLSEGRA
jgi:sugar phosphate isomerase/epimerase